MQFTLTYEGRLRSNAKPADKHALRRHFHQQLSTLWSLRPLADYRDWIQVPPTESAFSIIKPVHGFAFAPLVCEKLRAVAELEVDLLWPQSPGSIFVSGGDIDNRLKTLFDALKIPSEPSALPKGTMPLDGEKPFFCLLEDDSLISKVTVSTDRLLEPEADPSIVKLLLRVKTRNLGDQWKQLP